MSTVATSPERVREDLVRLAHRGTDVHDFALGATRILARAVPFEGVCVLPMDPATVMPTGAVLENGPPAAVYPQLRENEFRGRLHRVAHARPVGRHAATLSEATGGDLDRSERHREIMGPHGFGDELRAALVDGEATWGALVLMRGSDREPFSPADAAIVEAVTQQLAEGLRRAVLLDRDEPEPTFGEDAAGVVVLAPDGSTTFADEVAAAWMDELGGNGSAPSVVSASRPRHGRWRPARSTTAGSPGRACGPSRGAGWSCAAPCSQTARRAGRRDDRARAPARARAAHRGRLRLTEREREVTRLVARGLSTEAIAAQLYLSPWTVQDHLKAIFEKVGVATRGELVAHVFFGQQAPQL